jgi:hypothetical protein
MHNDYALVATNQVLEFLMSKTSGSTRTTISVPADLKRRMDKVKEPINWSALACAAFEQKLAEVAARKERKDMDDVIQRLRGSKQQHATESAQAGAAAGEQWAKDTAEAVELERLEQERVATGHDWDRLFDEDRDPADWLYDVMHPGHESDRFAPSSREFWEQQIGEDDLHLIDDNEWLRGFAFGAIQVWREVQSKL